MSALSELRILLASKSPRRKWLLEQAGLAFEIVDINVEETYPNDLAVEKVAAFLSEKKARAATPYLKSKGDVLLAADSTVILEGHIFEKPKDRDDGIRILSALSGRQHRVITGVCLKSMSKTTVFSSETLVTMEPLTPADIHYYLDTFKPYDKAGAYGIQDWLGLCKVSSIQGLYSNVMGLPVQSVYEALLAFRG